MQSGHIAGRHGDSGDGRGGITAKQSRSRSREEVRPLLIVFKYCKRDPSDVQQTRNSTHSSGPSVSISSPQRQGNDLNLVLCHS